MTFDLSRIILLIFCTGMMAGAFDYFRGNRWKLGEKFTAGIRAFEPLFLTMAGILVLIPLVRKVLAPVIAPLFSYTGADPALFAGTILANDMGAFQLAHTLSSDPDAADFSGMLIASVLGVNFAFTLPAALKMTQKEDHAFLFRGLLYGFATLPAGCLFGGLAAGYPFCWTVKQLVPVVLIAALSIVFLLFIPQKLTAVLSRIGRMIELAALVGIVIGIMLDLMKIHSGFASWFDPVGNAVGIVGSIVIVLPGAYVIIELISRAFRPVLAGIGKLVNINEKSVLGILSTLANSIPTFLMMREMDPRGKVLNAAFLTAGAFAFGDHLAFCCALAPKLVFPLLVTKLTGAVSAVLLCLFAEHFISASKKDGTAKSAEERFLMDRQKDDS